MPTDDRDVLEILKSELDFIEKGGYGRSVRMPWLPTSIFQDSLTCLNFGDPNRSHPCDECLLMALVPPEHRSEKAPCHHIPLTPEGETIEFLERNETQDVMEETVKNWLRRMIKILEEVSGRAGQAVSRRDGFDLQWLRLRLSSDRSPTMSTTVVIREWDCDTFHRRVLELEAQGYIARRDSYTVTPEMNPDTGEIIHLYSIEMQKPLPASG